MSTNHFINKRAREELGYNLWLLRRERNLNLQRLSIKTSIPTYIIDGMERGRHFEFNAFYKLADFYGKKMHIMFENK